MQQTLKHSHSDVRELVRTNCVQLLLCKSGHTRGGIISQLNGVDSRDLKISKNP